MRESFRKIPMAWLCRLSIDPLHRFKWSPQACSLLLFDNKVSGSSADSISAFPHLRDEKLPSHQARMDEGLELPQECRGLPRRGLAVHRQQPVAGRLGQEAALVTKPLPRESRAFRGLSQPREVGVRGDIGLADGGKGIFGSLVIPEAAPGSSGSRGSVVVRPFESVVDHPPDAFFEKIGDLLGPACEGGSDFGLVAFGKLRSKKGGLVDDLGTQRPFPPGEVSILHGHKEFSPFASPKDDPVEGKRVEQLVAEEDSSFRTGLGDGRRSVGDVPEPLFGEAITKRPAHRLPRFDRAVADPIQRVRPA